MEWTRATQVEGGGVKIPAQWVHLHYYEALNLLFRIENALRVFVYVVLKTEYGAGWLETHVLGDEKEGTIASIAAQRIDQARTYGYLGHPVVCPVMHLNSGELTRLIVSEAYWPLFKPHFVASKDVIKTKLAEIGAIRNSLAHFRPVRPDDVDVLKQNSRHIFVQVECLLRQVLSQTDTVPTNTEAEWYRSFATTGTDECRLSYRQSADGDWIRIGLHYRCPVVSSSVSGDVFARYLALTLDSSATLALYAELAGGVCYVVESAMYPKMGEGWEPTFGKSLSFVFKRETLETKHELLKESIDRLLEAISEETALIQDDHLARGRIVHTAVVTVSHDTDRKWSPWSWKYDQLGTPVTEKDPPEYWGSLSFGGAADFVSGASEYPWMPDTVAAEEIPF